MQKDTINGQEIEVAVIAADGTDTGDGLGADERHLLSKIDSAIHADAGFANACPAAILVRADSNRGFGDREEGRFYLCYKHKGGIAEFWGNAGDLPNVDVGSGVVAVSLVE